MPDMLNLHHPLLLLQQHRPLGIAQETPVEESSGLLDTVAGMFSERDVEDIAELFESQTFGFGNDASCMLVVWEEVRFRRADEKTLTEGLLSRRLYTSRRTK